MENEELADEVLNGAAATVDGFHLELRGRIMSAIQKARQEERERCAQVAERFTDAPGRCGCAARIRAIGTK
jgi:hypothetical protein